MIDRVGASFSLSIVIVALAAVILHRVETAGASTPAARVSGAIEGRTVPGPRPKPAQDQPGPEAIKPLLPSPTDAVRKSDVPDRHAPFTRAEAGETLADLAHRVYGQDTDVRAVWDLNRDQVADVAVPLERGLLLRTPEL